MAGSECQDPEDIGVPFIRLAGRRLSAVNKRKRVEPIMSAFAAANDTLFNDPHLGWDTVYTPEGGEPRAVSWRPPQCQYRRQKGSDPG